MTGGSGERDDAYEVLTSSGPGAIAVVRLRGLNVARFCERHLRPRPGGSFTLPPVGGIRRAALVDAAGESLDDVLVSTHAGEPAWEVYLHLHGNPWLVRRVAGLAESAGFAARRAPDVWRAPDRIEAEALEMLPQFPTLRGVTWLLEQVGTLRGELTRLAALAERDAESVRASLLRIAARGRVADWYTQPARVVLAGPVNAGKSTLANALADRAVSVVSAQPGTTRDWVEVPGEIDGYPVVWIDTAGLRATHDPLEHAGTQLTESLLAEADAVVLVLDATADGDSRAAFLETYRGPTPACIALNKCDLLPDAGTESPVPLESRSAPLVSISAAQARGLDRLTSMVLAGLGRNDAEGDQPAAFSPALAERLRTASAAGDAKSLSEMILRVLAAPGAPPGGFPG